MLKRTSIDFVNRLIKNNTGWKVLDIGCGFRANENATIIADIKDLSEYYKNKKFVKIESKKLPFNDKEFDYVIASHVIEHVDDFEFFIKELERISSKGYIELPTRLGDNLVFENKNDHIWWFVYDDISNQILASKRNQLVDPFMTVSTGKIFEKIFRESLVLEIAWENEIEYQINNELRFEKFQKISFLQLIKKYFSKIIRRILK